MRTKIVAAMTIVALLSTALPSTATNQGSLEEPVGLQGSGTGPLVGPAVDGGWISLSADAHARCHESYYGDWKLDIGYEAEAKASTLAVPTELEAEGDGSRIPHTLDEALAPYDTRAHVAHSEDNIVVPEDSYHSSWARASADPVGFSSESVRDSASVTCEDEQDDDGGTCATAVLRLNGKALSPLQNQAQSDLDLISIC